MIYVKCDWENGIEEEDFVLSFYSRYADDPNFDVDELTRAQAFNFL